VIADVGADIETDTLLFVRAKDIAPALYQRLQRLQAVGIVEPAR